MFRAYGYVHNGNAAVVSVDNDGRVRIYRVIHNTAVQDGEMIGAEMDSAVHKAQPMSGNVSPNMMRAIEGAMSLALAEARS